MSGKFLAQIKSFYLLKTYYILIIFYIGKIHKEFAKVAPKNIHIDSTKRKISGTKFDIICFLSNVIYFYIF